MSKDQGETIPKPLRSLLETGSMAGMTDGQLVERFAASRDSGGEAAFAALVVAARADGDGRLPASGRRPARGG